MSKIEEMLEMPGYYCILHNDDEYLVMCEKNGRIIGFETERKAVNFWERGYENSFNRDLPGATGAMIAFIQYNPSIVFFETQKKMFESLFEKSPFKKISFGDSFLSGILCQKDAEEFWENGIKPQLVEIVR